jgi:hypothetical protein
MHKFPGMITIFSTLINYVEFCASKNSGGNRCLVFSRNKIVIVLSVPILICDRTFPGFCCRTQMWVEIYN